MSQAAPANQLPVRLAQLARTLESRFPWRGRGHSSSDRGRRRRARRPDRAAGTAKSALIRMFARLSCRASYFEYPPHALHGAERDLRPRRHRRLPRGLLPAPHPRACPGLGGRLPRRGLQVELRDPETRPHALNERRYYHPVAWSSAPAARASAPRTRFRRTRRSPPSSTASSASGPTIWTPTTSRGLLTKGVQHRSGAHGRAGSRSSRRARSGPAPPVRAADAVHGGVLLPVQGPRLPDPRGRVCLRPPRRQAPEALLPRAPSSTAAALSPTRATSSSSSTSGTTRTRRDPRVDQ